MLLAINLMTFTRKLNFIYLFICDYKGGIFAKCKDRANPDEKVAPRNGIADIQMKFYHAINIKYVKTILADFSYLQNFFKLKR